MNIVVLVGIMIAIVVGVNLTEGGINTEVTEQSVEATSEYTQQIETVGETLGIGSLTSILAIVFVAVIILGAVAYLGFGDLTYRFRLPRIQKEDTYETIMEPPKEKKPTFLQKLARGITRDYD